MSTPELQPLRILGAYPEPLPDAVAGTPGSAAWRAAALDVIARRPAVPDQSALIASWPEELTSYDAQLRRSTAAQRMFNDGWHLALITDIGQLIAAQGSLVLSHPPQVPAPADLQSLAWWTLPLSTPPAQIPAEFDAQQQVWRIASPNPNLRITGRFGGEVRPGALGFGFVVEILTSYLSVAEYRGRFVLRDGYHRVYAALGAGIRQLPAFVKHYDATAELFARDMLPEPVWTGDHPPLLSDFRDDRLAYEAERERHDTTVYVQARPASLAIEHQA